ncbi:hypothetical protein, conserved [Leishmania tarentolae]|uniref:Uncharacterized protein n=1 Tax=Leishmania tarentolae TaxID=5689 RepID=A0A640KEH6_LEITA|nr:hypothetical protein, conserved [Leishmania tarentolae]
MSFSGQGSRRGSGGKTEGTAMTDNGTSPLSRQAKAATAVPQPAAAAAAAVVSAASATTNGNSLSSPAAAPARQDGGAPIPCSAAQLSEEYEQLLDVVGTPNYETIQRLFSGDATPPASTVPMVQVSFELFEAVQNRFAATKQVLERTKADLLTRNQHYSALHQEMLQLKDEYTVLQNRSKEAEERNTELHQQLAKLEVTVEQLDREVGQGRTALDTLRSKLLHKEEELQLSQSRVAETLVTLSQKEAVIGTLRRELGKCGHLRYAPAAGQRDGLREGVEDVVQDGGDGANSHAYTADMLGRIAADIEGRSQEARVKLNMADLEGRLARLGEEKTSVLAQHTRYRQHVELALQSYETDAMLREDTLARHTCVHTPYFAGEQAELYAKIVHLQTGEDLTEEQRGSSDTMDADAGVGVPASLRSFSALTFEIRRIIDRLSKMQIDDASRQKQELSRCTDAQLMLLRTSTELVGFLSTMEEEVLRRRLTLPEVREEWHKAKVPEFVRCIAQSLQEGASQFCKGLVGLLQQENIFIEELQQARVLQQQQQQALTAGKRTSTAASAAGDRASRKQRGSFLDGKPLKDRSGVASDSRSGGRESDPSMQLTRDGARRQGSLRGDKAAKVVPATASTGGRKGSGKEEGENVTASTASNKLSAAPGAQKPPASTESSLVAQEGSAAGHAAAPTSWLTQIGSSSNTSEAHGSSAADTRASPESRLQSRSNMQTCGGITTGKDTAEVSSAAAPFADASQAIASSSAENTPTCPGTAPFGIPATTSRTNQGNRACGTETVAEQMANRYAVLPHVPSVVVCPHCEHDVLVNAATGTLLSIPVDVSDGGGAGNSLSVSDASASASPETGGKTSSALTRLAPVCAVLIQSPESLSSDWGSGVTKTTDTQPDGSPLTKSFTTATKSKGKGRTSNTSGTTEASGKRPKRESLTGSCGAPSSPASSPKTSPDHLRTHGSSTSNKPPMPVNAYPVLAHDEQRIGMNSPTFYIDSNTSLAVFHSRRAEDNAGTAVSAATRVSVAELVLVLSDCQERLAHTMQELQDMQLANAELQAQLAVALASAAARAPALESSMTSDAHNTADINSNAEVTDPASGSTAAQMAAEGSQATPQSSGRKVDKHGKPTTTISKMASNRFLSSTSATEVEEEDLVATTANDKPSHHSSSASPTTPLQRTHAVAHRGGAASRDRSTGASTAGAAAGEGGSAAWNARTSNSPVTASSPPSPAFSGGSRDVMHTIAHKDEQPGTTGTTLVFPMASARESQWTTASQQFHSTDARSKAYPTWDAEAMDDGAEPNCGGKLPGGSTSTHNSHSTALRQERSLPFGSPSPQRHSSKQAGGGLASVSATQSQQRDTSTSIPVLGSAYLPALYRRPHALKRATPPNTSGTAFAALHRAIDSSVSVPHKTQTLGLVITNSRVTSVAAMQSESDDPGAYASSSTKSKGAGHASRAEEHTVPLKLPSSLPHLLTRGLRKCASPSLPPLTASQVPLQQHLQSTFVSSSKNGCPPTSSLSHCSPVPKSAEPTALEAGAGCSHDTLPTIPCTTAGASSWLAVLGSNIVSPSPPHCPSPTMPQQSMLAWVSSPISAAAPTFGTATTGTTNYGPTQLSTSATCPGAAPTSGTATTGTRSYGPTQLSTSTTCPGAAEGALGNRQQLKIAYQQLRLLRQGVSMLQSGRDGAQPSTEVGAANGDQFARWPRGGAWYVRPNSSTRGRLRQVMARPVRGTWVRSHLYEAPILASPASVMQRDSNTNLDLIVGGRALHPQLGSPCNAFGHAVTGTGQDVPSSSLIYISGTPIAQAITYLATPAETQRPWTSKRFLGSPYDSCSLSVANKSGAMVPRLRQRMPRTWQQQKRWHIRKSRGACAAGVLGCAPYASAPEQVASSAGGVHTQQVPPTLPQRRVMQLPQFHFAASSAVIIRPISAPRLLPAPDCVSPLFMNARKRRGSVSTSLHRAKRDPMQRAVKRTVYTVGIATSPAPSQLDALSNTLTE